MITAFYYNQVYTMFVGYFGRPPAKPGLDYYVDRVKAAGGILDVVIDDFFNSAESQAYFSGKTIEQQVHQIFQNLFGRDAAPSGLNYWTGMISTGKVALAQAAYTIASNAAAADTAILTAKVDSAKLWVSGLDTTTELEAFSTSTGLAAGRDFLKTVTSSAPATQTAVDAALKAMVDYVVVFPTKSSLSTNDAWLMNSILTDSTTSNFVDEFDQVHVFENAVQSAEVVNGSAATDTEIATVAYLVDSDIINLAHEHIRCDFN